MIPVNLPRSVKIPSRVTAIQHFTVNHKPNACKLHIATSAQCPNLQFQHSAMLIRKRQPSDRSLTDADYGATDRAQTTELGRKDRLCELALLYVSTYLKHTCCNPQETSDPMPQAIDVSNKLYKLVLFFLFHRSCPDNFLHLSTCRQWRSRIQ